MAGRPGLHGVRVDVSLPRTRRQPCLKIRARVKLIGWALDVLADSKRGIIVTNGAKINDMTPPGAAGEGGAEGDSAALG